MYQPRLERFRCPILVGGEKRAKTGTLSREIHTCANREPSILRIYSYSIKLMKPTWVEDHTSRLYPCIVWSQDYCCFDNSKLHLAREELQLDVRLDGCCHCWPCSCRTSACKDFIVATSHQHYCRLPNWTVVCIPGYPQASKSLGLGVRIRMNLFLFCRCFSVGTVDWSPNSIF